MDYEENVYSAFLSELFIGNIKFHIIGILGEIHMQDVQKRTSLINFKILIVSNESSSL